MIYYLFLGLYLHSSKVRYKAISRIKEVLRIANLHSSKVRYKVNIESIDVIKSILFTFLQG